MSSAALGPSGTGLVPRNLARSMTTISKRAPAATHTLHPPGPPPTMSTSHKLIGYSVRSHASMESRCSCLGKRICKSCIQPVVNATSQIPARVQTPRADEEVVRTGCGNLIGRHVRNATSSAPASPRSAVAGFSTSSTESPAGLSTCPAHFLQCRGVSSEKIRRRIHRFKGAGRLRPMKVQEARPVGVSVRSIASLSDWKCERPTCSSIPTDTNTLQSPRNITVVVFGVTVRAFNVSKEQIVYARERASREDWPARSNSWKTTTVMSREPRRVRVGRDARTRRAARSSDA